MENKEIIKNIEEALEYLEKKLSFNKKMEQWEKEYQAIEFIEKYNNWSKKEILAHFFWYKNNVKKSCK